MATDRRRAPAPELLVVLGIGVLLRAALLVVGRDPITDGFYTQAAALLGRGKAPYEDFVHVAFPFVEGLYAAIAWLDHPLAVASAITGLAVVATALALAHMARHQGRFTAVAAALLYLSAAPLIAFHTFEREIWSACFVALAAAIILPRPTTADDRAATCGLLLALALFSKLTAAIGVATLLIELLWRRQVRAALIAASVLALAFLSGSLLLYGRFGDEFASQVFLFFFMKGEAGAPAIRLTAMLTHIDANLALGAIGLLLLAFRRSHELRFAALFGAAWLLYYLVLSPSYWDHNAIDLALPAALGAAWLLDRARRRHPLGLAVLLAIGLLAGWRGLGPQRPQWYPLGFGGSAPAVVAAEAAALRSWSDAGDLVQASTPIVAVAARRTTLFIDFEVEPVALATLAEVRVRGLLATLARRRHGADLGAPQAASTGAIDAPLFVARRDAAIRRHILPRLADAIRNRELRALSVVLPPGLSGLLDAHGYAPCSQGPIHGHQRR